MLRPSRSQVFIASVNKNFKGGHHLRPNFLFTPIQFAMNTSFAEEELMVDFY